MRGKKAVSGVILAGGKSSRMEGIKQLLPFKGRSLLLHVLQNALKSSLFEIVVVLGFAAEEIAASVDLSPAKIVFNQEYEKGQSTSLRSGMQAVSHKARAVMFLLADQPLVGPEIIDTIIESHFRNGYPFIIPTYQGRRGNPVLVHRSLFASLENIKGDQGARALFESKKDLIHYVEVPHGGIHFDVDYWQDYQELVGNEPV